MTGVLKGELGVDRVVGRGKQKKLRPMRKPLPVEARESRPEGRREVKENKRREISYGVE